MLKKEDVKKLADLSRIDMEDSELTNLAKEVDSILGYVGQISSVVVGKKEEVQLGEVFNVFREDKDPNKSGEYSKSLLAEAPMTERGFIKVKKIL